MSTPPTSPDMIFELRYKKGGIVQTARFRQSTLAKAVTLGRTYCEANTLHFIHVDPWEVDLQDLLERKMTLGRETL